MMTMSKHWVVCPPRDSVDEDNPFYYGCKQSDDFKLYIVSGCCGEPIAPKKGLNAECSLCFREFPISEAMGSIEGEDSPFVLYWGQFTWDRVEERMHEWLDFYFNLKAGGEVMFWFDGKTQDTYVEES